MDRFRRRSPEARYPPSSKDTYIPTSRSARPRSRSPGGYRARSRTPPGRSAIDSYRGPRRYEAAADTYAPRTRSPRREYPPDHRYDDVGAGSRDRGGMRSPPPSRRERVASPPRDYGRTRSPPRPSYRPRSRSPRRSDRPDSYAQNDWRRRSPSPRSRRPDGWGEGSGRNSLNNSRRSSPRPPPRGPDPYPSESYRSASATYRSPRPRSPARREPPPRVPSPRSERAQAYTARSRAPPGHTDGYAGEERAASPPDGPAPSDYQQRPPPTGPASSYRDPRMSPPTGPSSATMSASTHSRPNGNFESGSGGYPRGGGRGGFRGRGYTPEYQTRDRFAGAPSGPEAYPSRPRGRGGWNDAPSYGRGGPSHDHTSYDTNTQHRREPFGFHGRGGRGGIGGGGGNGTSFTTPRTQRFNQHVADVPKIKEGGEKLPSLYDTTKADKLEEEAARLRKLIDDKEIKKRQGLREWDRLETETKIASLRSDLAEEHLRSLNGEESIGTAAF